MIVSGLKLYHFRRSQPVDGALATWSIIDLQDNANGHNILGKKQEVERMRSLYSSILGKRD